MISIRIWAVLFTLVLSLNSGAFATVDAEISKAPLQITEPVVGSWTFSGMVNNESGEKYGYFFQIQRQGADFRAKTALIDGQTNQLVLFYESKEKIENSTQLNWHVGRSFIRYNPINDSWIFGLKKDNDEKSFNFKVDMLKESNTDNETLILRPGVELQALQTSRLNGHIQLGDSNKEQFVTGNNAWFAKVWFSKEQSSSHDINAAFCRLSDDNGFYSANLKEADATGAAVAGWRDAIGNKVKMSQFISIKTVENDHWLLSLGLPKLKLNVINTLKSEEKAPFDVAGFSTENPKGFCFITAQSFAQTNSVVPDNEPVVG